MKKAGLQCVIVATNPPAKGNLCACYRFFHLVRSIVMKNKPMLFPGILETVGNSPVRFCFRPKEIRLPYVFRQNIGPMLWK
jgi:hypothetical protein